MANAISRSPNLRGPTVPPGFSTRVTHILEKPLNDTDVYISAIEAMYHFASPRFWDYEVPYLDIFRSEIVRGLEVSFQVNIPDRPIKMKWSHVICTVLIAVDSMDRSQAFAETIVAMNYEDQLFGVMKIGKSTEKEKPNDSKGQPKDSIATAKRDDENSVSIENIKRAAPNPNTSPHSKTIIDPEVPIGRATTIIYQRFGRSVPCNLLFSTALDSIAYAAADDWGDTWPYSTCYNWSKKMMYQTVQVNLGDGRSEWTADFIKRVARLLPERLFEEGDCGEVRFRVELEDVGRVGTGSFQVPNFAKQGPRGLSR
ncbi:MAG: hypothetical protein LQ350_008537 [Teloschistes chrysophthalmus]|nr:MAG: hypothetical protein LQ350_008537 [Niorma chrysophthalma]